MLALYGSLRKNFVVRILALPICLAPGALCAQECLRINLSSHPLLRENPLAAVDSAVPISESTLVLTDSFGGNVLKMRDYTDLHKLKLDYIRGHLLRDDDKKIADRLVKPDLLYGRQDSLIQFSLDARHLIDKVLWFDADLSKRGETDLLPPERSAIQKRGGSGFDYVIATYNAIVTGRILFAYGVYGALQDAPVYNYGFFRHDLQPLGNRNVIPKAELVLSSTEWTYYTLPYPFIVSTTNQGIYFLEMSYYPSLYFYDTLDKNFPVLLEGLPGEEVPLKQIKNTNRPDFMAAVEKISGPTGLYEQDGYLYLLSRQATQQKSEWKSEFTLTKLRPLPRDRAVEVLGVVRLPTLKTTQHLTIVPAASWLIFEKSAVRKKHENDKRGEQDIRLLTIPKSWITDPINSPLLAARSFDPADCLAVDVTVAESFRKAPAPVR